MITSIAAYITQRMVEASVIKKYDKDLYQYGFYLILSRIIFFFISGMVGFFLGIYLESILFYLVFSTLRTYAGGVHAKTERSCTIFTIIALSTSIFGIKLLEHTSSMLISTVMLIFGSLSIVLFSPLDTYEKPLEKVERHHYRAICLLLLVSCIILAIISRCFFWNAIFYPIIVSIFLEAILLCIGRVTRCNHPEQIIV